MAAGSSAVALVSLLLDDAIDAHRARKQKVREAGSDGVVCLLHPQWTGPAGNGRSAERTPYVYRRIPVDQDARCAASAHY